MVASLHRKIQKILALCFIFVICWIPLLWKRTDEIINPHRQKYIRLNYFQHSSAIDVQEKRNVKLQQPFDVPNHFINLDDKPKLLSSNILPDGSKRNARKVVPNIIHYIWFYPQTRCFFKFYQFMSLLSVNIFIKPKQIMFWYDNKPCGKWWNETISRVTMLILKKLDPPQTIFGQPIRVPEHRSDVARLNILLKHGGIYLDTDIIALKSWDSLLYYNTTLGIQTKTDLGNAVIIAIRNSKFLQLWKDSYREFNDNKWMHNSCVVPLRLAKKYPHLIHVEFNTLYVPNSKDTQWIFGKDKLWDWSGSYGIHLYYRLYKKSHNEQDIKRLNTTLGRIFCLLYYNTTRLIY